MNVLIIGFGSIAKKHVSALLQIVPNVQIWALRSSKSAPTVSDVHNIYTLSELSVVPDFCIISNPTSKHLQAIAEVAALQVPLFIEKPLSASIAQGEEVLSIIQKHNLKTYVACNLRFHPALQFFKAMLLHEEIKINEVNVYCGSFLPEWRPTQDYTQSYSANKALGGGVHLDLIHEIDYIYWIFGKPKNTEGRFFSRSSIKIDAVDAAYYLLTYSDFNVQVGLNYFRRDPKRMLEVVTDEETLTIDLLKCKVQGSKSGLLFEQEHYTMLETYPLQLNYFIQSLLKNKPLMNEVNEAFEVLKITLENVIEQ